MSRFIKVDDAIKLPLLGNDDYLQRGKGRMLTWAPYVFEDMNLSVLKKAIRQEFKINKRTNTVDLPCNESELSSVSVMDHHGVIWPVYRNDKLHDDIVEIPAGKDCNCENNCGYQLCNTIKGYEAISTVKTDSMPDGTPVSFTCVDRKAIDRNGFLYQESQYPLRIFSNGVWTNTIKFTEEKKLCKLECDDKGCVCDTDANLNAVCNACGINPVTIPIGGTAETPPSPQDTKWIYHCHSKLDFFAIQCGRHPFFHDQLKNIYNISELGNRLIFPHNFAFRKVIIRWYDIPNLKDIEIPFIAVDVFASGLKWFDVRWNDKMQNLEPKFSADYSKGKWGLFETMNKYTLAEIGMMLAPPRSIPSYIDHRLDDFGRF